MDVDARIEIVVVEVRDELGALVLVALELEVEAPRDAAERVREMALHSGGLVCEPVADVLGDGLAVGIDDLDVARQAVVGIEIRLAMSADEERRVDGAPAAVGLAEHDVGAHRQALVDFRRVRELGVVERAVHVVAEQELGIAGLVLEHVRRVQLGRHEARRMHDGRHERLRRIGEVGVRLGRRTVDVVVLPQARGGCELELADARRRARRRRATRRALLDGAGLAATPSSAAARRRGGAGRDRRRLPQPCETPRSRPPNRRRRAAPSPRL